MKSASRPAYWFVVLAAALLAVAPVRGDDWAADDEIFRKLDTAKAEAGAIPEQARALALLAWPDEPQGDPRLRALARRQIVGFADRGLDALAERMRTAPPRYAADITSAIMETRLVAGTGLAPRYLPALYDAIWFGPPEAKRLAMPELARYRFPPSMLTIIDAADESPRLAGVVIESLGLLGDDRARHYLGGVLMSGDPAHLEAAAAALAKIGGRSIETLRDATLAPRAEIRAASIDALIPVSRVEDLTILYEYLQQFSEQDDARRIELVTQRARQLESLLESREYQDSSEHD